MPTHKFDDIIPPSRRREVEPLRTGRPTDDDLQRPARRSRFPYLTILIVLIVVAAGAGAIYYFSSATVEVVPTTLSATVQGSYTASSSSGDLPFKIITAQKVATQTVQGSGTKTVSSSASGSITIYNTQAKAQTLIANTRFATTAGLIFRIHAAVTIPAGTTAKPGAATAKVYADQAGTSYNVAATSFTIPGFAGTPQASAVYARSTAPMTGGASGPVPVVDAVTESAARAALTTALAPDLASSLQSQIPADYVLLAGAATTTYEALTSASSATSGMVDVKEQGTITAVVFPNASLAKAIASSVPGLNYQGGPLTLASSTTLALVPGAGMNDPNATSVTFTLSGPASFVYSVDSSRIAAAVAGKTSEAAKVSLTNYPEVARAIIVLRPFWRQTFPDDPAAIKVVVMAP